MPVAGIIAEYNPFHSGHAWQIAQTKSALGSDCAVVCVMSGNWIQQAECAQADKWTRARLALLGGVDLVVELPTVFATASAEQFARTGVALLEATGVVDTLSFGSECGEIAPLLQIADALDAPDYQTHLRRGLEEGLAFAVARQNAVNGMLGSPAELLSGANNNLGVEYLRALQTSGSAIRPMTVRREGTAHNAPRQVGAQFTSATDLRNKLRSGAWADAGHYLLAGEEAILRQTPLAQLDLAERAVLARVRTMTAEEWAALPDSAPEEGLPQRLAKMGHRAASLSKFYDLVKTKRYTHARIRRLALMAYLGITQVQRKEKPAYLRVLGMNKTGQALLRDMKTKASLPVLTKPAHAKGRLSEAGQRQFEGEVKYTDLYDLCLPQLCPGGREWVTGPVLWD